MKIFVEKINPHQGPIVMPFIEIKVIFYDDITSPHHEAAVIVFLEKENISLPMSQIETVAIQKAKNFLLNVVTDH